MIHRRLRSCSPHVRSGSASGAAALDGGITVDTSNFTVNGSTGAVATLSTLSVAGLVSDSNGPFGVNDNTSITGTLSVSGLVNDSNGPLGLNDNTSITGTLTASGAAALDGGISVDTSNFTVNGTTGAVATLSTLSVGGLVSDSNGPFGVISNMAVTGTLTVSGLIADSNGPLGLNDNTSITGTLTASGLATLDGGIAVDTSNFTVNGSTGAVSTASTLAVGGMVSDSNGPFGINDSASITGSLTVADGDLTLTARSDNNNAGNINEIIGVPRIEFYGLGDGVDGTGQTLELDDDTPAGEWVSSGAGITCTNSTDYRHAETNSLKVAIGLSTVGAQNCHDGVSYDFTDDESVGMWVWPTVDLDAGDLAFQITDNPGGAVSVTLPALTANKWTWVELAISAVANDGKDAITDLALWVSYAGAKKAAAYDVYVDYMVKWDAADEKTLGQAIQTDGVLGVINVLLGTNLTEYTDYFINYVSGADNLIYVTNQSAAKVALMYAY